MEQRIQYKGFDSKWAKDRHITLTTMKPGHLIRINKNNELRFVITGRTLCTYHKDAELPFHMIDGNSEDKLHVKAANAVVVGGQLRGTRYDLVKLTERNIREMLMQTKFYLEIAEVILPTFETKEQSNIAYEDA